MSTSVILEIIALNNIIVIFESFYATDMITKITWICRYAGAVTI